MTRPSPRSSRSTSASPRRVRSRRSAATAATTSRHSQRARELPRQGACGERTISAGSSIESSRRCLHERASPGRTTRRAEGHSVTVTEDRALRPGLRLPRRTGNASCRRGRPSRRRLQRTQFPQAALRPRGRGSLRSPRPPCSWRTRQDRVPQRLPGRDKLGRRALDDDDLFTDSMWIAVRRNSRRLRCQRVGPPSTYQRSPDQAPQIGMTWGAPSAPVVASG